MYNSVDFTNLMSSLIVTLKINYYYYYYSFNIVLVEDPAIILDR
jgi:hypothetical protein